MKYVLTAVLFLAIGLGVGFSYGKSVSQNTKIDTGTGTEEGVPEQQLPESIVTMGQGQEVKQLVGKVKSISGNTLVFIPESLADSTLGPSLKERTVTIGEGTKVTKLIPRDPAVIEKELEAMKRVAEETERLKEEAIAAGAKPALGDVETVPNAPAAFESVDAESGNITAGDRVSITTEGDVRTLPSFTASWIQILPLPPIVEVSSS